MLDIGRKLVVLVFGVLCDAWQLAESYLAPWMVHYLHLKTRLWYARLTPKDNFVNTHVNSQSGSYILQIEPLGLPLLSRVLLSSGVDLA